LIELSHIPNALTGLWRVCQGNTPFCQLILFGTYFETPQTKMLRFLVRLIDSIVWPLVIVVSIWVVFFINLRYGLDLNHYGMRPQEWRGLWGIFTMPFLHGDFDHLFSNSIPLLLSMGFIFIYFDKERVSILVLNTLLTGIILLAIGEQGSNHIGASGLVYAFIFFLVTHAIISWNKEMLGAAFLLIFLYGSLIYGIFPEYGRIVGKSISWEGHLSGAISGLVFGFLYRKNGPQQAQFFEEEREYDDDDGAPDAYWKIPEQQPQKTKVHYNYKEKK
jgi:membrane associated rhomboid family serine protease